jgi:hypothetical protein
MVLEPKATEPKATGPKSTASHGRNYLQPNEAPDYVSSRLAQALNMSRQQPKTWAMQTRQNVCRNTLNINFVFQEDYLP